MIREYSILKTTREERELIINEGLALSALGATPPAPEDQVFINKYLDGELEIEEILQLVIKKYTQPE